MDQKNIVATIYLKNGQAVKGFDDHELLTEDVFALARLYNDSGIDKIIIFDLSEDDEEHEKNIHTIKIINRNMYGHHPHGMDDPTPLTGFILQNYPDITE